MDTTDSTYDNLPVFNTPPPLPPPQTEEELRQERRAGKSADVLKAEELCIAGDLFGTTSSVKELLQAGAYPPTLQDCLLEAVQFEHEDLAGVLLSIGVPWRLSTIKAAINRHKTLRVLSLLVQHGWNINEPESWWVPAQLAYAMSKHPDEALVSWFLSNGADLNKSCEMDITPLSTAVEIAPLPIVKQLFNHFPPSTVFHGQLLHRVSSRTLDDCDKALLLVLEKCKPDINSILYGDHIFSYTCHKAFGLGTALHEAAKEGRPSIARMLIERGVDVSIRDSMGETALEVAEREENDGVAEVIRQAVAAQAKAGGAKV